VPIRVPKVSEPSITETTTAETMAFSTASDYAWSVRENEDVVTIDTENTPNDGSRFLGTADAHADGEDTQFQQEEKAEVEGMFRYYDQEADNQVYRRRSSKPVEDQLPGASPPFTPSGAASTGFSAAAAADTTGTHGTIAPNNPNKFEDDEEHPTRRVALQRNEKGEDKKLSGDNSSCCQVYCCGRQVTWCTCCLALAGALLLVGAAAFGGTLLAHYATEEWGLSWPRSNSASKSASSTDTTTTVMPQTSSARGVPAALVPATTQPTITRELMAEARLAAITDVFVEASRGAVNGTAIDLAIVWVASEDMAKRSAADPFLVQRIVLASMVIEGPMIASWLTSLHECEWEGVECGDNEKLVQGLHLGE
jgi:hypothetical protein